MLTAKEGEWDEVEGLDVGADDFLRKPFERIVLVARLHALLRRQERGRPQALSVGAVSLDPVTRHVSAYGRRVTLTPREFSLLEYLMSHANATLAKSEILADVWGSDFDGDQNIVEVYVGYLRKKIDVADEPSIIRTVRGVRLQRARDLMASERRLSIRARLTLIFVFAIALILVFTGVALVHLVHHSLLTQASQPDRRGDGTDPDGASPTRHDGAVRTGWSSPCKATSSSR